MQTWPNPLCLQLALLGLVATWGVSARATPEFPGIVEQTLGLTKIEIDPPMGCMLCHTSDSGGTSLRPFGVLLQQDGTQPYEDNTLEAALGQVEEDQPQLIADIKAGVDPNDDPDASSTPTPEYGCSASRGLPRGFSGWSLAVAALFAVAWGRRRRSQKCAVRIAPAPPTRGAGAKVKAVSFGVGAVR
ncbi:MAG: hypothetical protein ACLQVI_28275 [Polyangiaceae bacterium]